MTKNNFKALATNAMEPDEIDALCFEWLIANAPEFGNDGLVARKILEIAKELMR